MIGAAYGPASSPVESHDSLVGIFIIAIIIVVLRRPGNGREAPMVKRQK
jgi:hypothetical protein